MRSSDWSSDVCSSDLSRGAVDAVGLLGELAQGQKDEVGRAQHRQGGDGAGEHACLEAEFLCDARGERIEDGAGMDTAVAGEKRAEALPAVGPAMGRARSMERMRVWV